MAASNPPSAPRLRQVSSAFAIPGDFEDASPYGSGHINDTFCVLFSQGGTRVRYLLQRLNTRIFRNPSGLMDNVARICAHAQQRLRAEGAADASRRALTLIPTRAGGHFHADEEGGVWRCYIFVEGARGYDSVQNPGQAFQAARAFGAFQRLLVDLPGGRLVETIPDFHNTVRRHENLLRSINADIRNRAAGVRPEIEFFARHAESYGTLSRLMASGRIPERVTHNDTKLNNVLIDDATQEGVCVIDLDTCMPGSALYDFGDLVRTSTSPAAEDERDLAKVRFQEDCFEALARGYLAAARDFLNATEREHLAFAGQLITMEIGMRFLTDYLDGDVYFKTAQPGHNLDRCRTQIRLATCIERRLDTLNRFVASL